MVNYILIIPIVVSFFITLFILPAWIKRAKLAGLVGKDVNKLEKIEISESGGVIVIISFAFGLLVYIALNTFLFNSDSNFIELFALMSTILLIVFVAFTDDILGWKIGLRRRTRLIFVIFSSIPLIAINAGRSDVGIPLIGTIDLGIIYPLIIIPLGIVGATTTFNFLAGFNGLETGQGILLLSALAIVSYFTGSLWLSIISLIMVSSLFAFLIYNFFPASVLPGDSLTYAVGGLIAIIAILGNFEKIALFFFIPYIIETGLKLRGGLIKQSFGKPNERGSLDLKYPKIYSLNHVAILLMKKMGWESTEKRAVYLIWAFQIMIILIGFILFSGGIFT